MRSKIDEWCRLLRAFGVVGVVAFAMSIQAQTPSPTPAPTTTSGPTGGLFTTYDGAVLRKGEFTFSGVYHGGPIVWNEKLSSKLMAREMPYRIILPAGYSDPRNSAKRYPVVFLLHGLGGHFDNWTNKTKLTEYDEAHGFIIVTPEGGDGWYTDSSTQPNDKYESYIIKELIPEIDKKFRTIADRDHRAIAGLSMGGYGAIKFGLKYSELFSIVGSFSGALDGPLRGQEHKNYRPSIMAVFGPDNSPLRKENDVFSIVNSMSLERLKTLPYFYVSCGTEDTVNFLLNRDFAGMLVEKKIRHEYRHFPGAHTWVVWDAEVQEFLRVVRKRFVTTP